jgi:predicted GTPase
MAIDKDKFNEVVKLVEDFQNAIPIPEEAKKWVIQTMLGPSIDLLKKYITESREPIIYIIGRSGHGKSSLINALANKNVAEVGHIKPTTRESEVYLIEFPETYSKWTIIDSRGIFETTTPDGGAQGDVVEYIKNDINKYNPDVLLHVIAAPEVRNLKNDFEIINEINENITRKNNPIPPTLMVLTKIDHLGNPREWPPENFPGKTKLIEELMDYMVTDVLKSHSKHINDNEKSKGGYIDKLEYIGLLPVCSLDKDHWNIELLSHVIGTILPQNAKLFFFQAQQRKSLLRELSSEIIKRFSTIASGIGASPIPFSDIIVLTPIQLLLIIIIAGLSCRSLEKKTAIEFLSAAGLNVGAGVGLRYLAQTLLKIIPGWGWALSASIAGGGDLLNRQICRSIFF